MKHLRLPIVKLLQRTKLNKLAHHAYYNYFHGFDTANKDVLPALDRCFKKAVEMRTAEEGDYYEFGLFKGYAFWHAQQVAQRHNLSTMRFFGFDSFAGLPKVQGPDKTKEDVFYKGQYACSKDEVARNLTSKGVDWERTVLVEGYFADSLTVEAKRKHQMKQAAIVLIDCDLYISTAEVLEFISDLVMDKTILMFDDWNCFDRDNNRGQRKAFREFQERSPRFQPEELFSYGLYGQVFLLQLKGVPEAVPQAPIA